MTFGDSRRYRLHMNNGSPTVEGLLVKRARREFVLIAASILQDVDTTQPLVGRVEVPREHVYVLERVD